ncbi:MAG: ABC transporter permease [Candidatus Methanomethyliaceae archaeon]
MSVSATFLAFGLLSSKFFRLDTIGGIATITAEIAVVSVPLALLIMSGEFDLSVGSVYAFAGVLAAILLNLKLSEVAVLCAVLLFGGVAGLLNGLLTTKLRLPSFIVTLGMMFTLRGLLLVITAGFPVSFKGNSYMLQVFNGKLWGEFRMSSIWLALITGLFYIVVNMTKHGNWSLACGGNVEVARALGVPVVRVKRINFFLTGLFAAFGGLLAFARFGMAYPTLAEGLELESIAAVVLGGCSLGGGYGTVWGALLGSILIASLRVGLVLAGAPAYWYRAFIGLILIGGMIINKQTMRKILGVEQ